MKLRWNTTELIWEFWEEAWGGWCVLRDLFKNSNRPMTLEEGVCYVANNAVARLADIAAIGQTSRPTIQLVLFKDTETEPRALQ